MKSRPQETYRSPEDRKRCETCRHFDVVTIRPRPPGSTRGGIYAMHCALGDFQVTRFGVCDLWKRKGS